ncbi:MAG: hypothetical protein V2I40_03615 [Desulfobacteraceae bacterium]|jgi:hypothetical protein|nr:hypothetical protein [Desulfobacteraceae bacterium]
MNDSNFYAEIEKVKDDAVFFVAHSKANGEPFAIIEAPGCTAIKKGSSATIPTKDLIEVLKELEGRGEVYVDTTATTVIHVHGSPGCYIKTASGGWKCICCG